MDKDYSVFREVQRRESAKGKRFIGISYKDVLWEDIESSAKDKKGEKRKKGRKEK